LRNSFDVGWRRGRLAAGPCSARNRRLAVAASARGERLGLSAIGLSINCKVVKRFDSSVVMFFVSGSGFEICSQRVVDADSLVRVGSARALVRLFNEIKFLFTGQ
jgi:hypothetical protein